MKTIRGKIISFFVLCLAFAALLTFLYYQSAFSLRRKLYAIEQFDDLLNDVLELRRYEKNFLFYRDTSSLKEELVYLERVEKDYLLLKEDIAGIMGSEESEEFAENLTRYRQILHDNIGAQSTLPASEAEKKFRTEGKYLVDFAQNLIQKKRARIGQTLSRVLIIPLASITTLVVLVIIIFRFVTTGILKPLLLVESATEKVARDSFTPIAYDRDRQDEISRLIASFNKMAGELESRQEQLIQSRKLASIGTLTSGIAHELNNPLNNVSITAEVLKLNYHDLGEAQVMEMIDEILTQTERASQIVKNLLEFSRTERPHLGNLHIHDIIDQTLNLIKNQLVVARLQVEKRIAEGLPLIRGKRQDLQQALVNILLNGIQAMPDGGAITINADRGPEGYLRIDVSDTGTGIPPEALEQIFDPFFTTKGAGQGTGLGLSLVYSIIRTHGGYIEVKSEEGEGTTFSIFLPVLSEKDIPDEQM
ncbi:MAG: ATP-binding protein [Deltaproteobacteria bacterium]